MLKIHIDQVDTHVHFRVFWNGALCGKLTVRKEEFMRFADDMAMEFQSVYLGDPNPHVFSGLIDKLMENSKLPIQKREQD